MWKLISVSAKNICAFEELGYTLNQGNTTLIFGKNKDNNSQSSNGSGKSTILEAIALGITGEPLRKVNMDEIVRDGENEAEVMLCFSNYSIKTDVIIVRNIFRKSSQTISIQKKFDGNTEDVACPSISEYNQYILDMLGLTKEDIYNNFILSKNKYKSFLSSPDRDKKEIINRFSNGDLVDESLAALISDEDPIQNNLNEAHNNVVNYEGRVAALEEQIKEEENNSESSKESNKAKIEECKKNIKETKESIEALQKNIKDCTEREKSIIKLNDEVADYDSNKKTTLKVAYDYLIKVIADNELESIKDYTAESNDIIEDINSKKAALEKCRAEEEEIYLKMKQTKTLKDKTEKEKAEAEEEYYKFLKCSNDDIKTISDNLEKVTIKIKDLGEKGHDLKEQIADLKNKMAGSIECPKCHHVFVLDSDIDLVKATKDLQILEKKKIENDMKISSAEDSERTFKKDIADKKKFIDECYQKFDEIKQKYRKISETYSNLNDDTDNLTRKENKIKNSILDYQNELDNLRNNMFDEFYDIIDAELDSLSKTKTKSKSDISLKEGYIESYKESIEKIKNSSVEDVTNNLKISRDKYKNELKEAIDKEELIKTQLDKYKEQEKIFLEFKTHLANTKIESLSHITNEFLSKIGSDIRIKFSGYTMLKTGKLRDKISVTLLRNGVECGSFAKFSEGEKCRVELANILALHELSNLNCENDKGLDLLVLDEILDACDEQGLSNMFNALNLLNITSLIVSQGNIAEGYPYKLMVSKSNDVSYLDVEEK